VDVDVHVIVNVHVLVHGFQRTRTRTKDKDMPLRPTSKEDEYFAREDAIKLRKLAAKEKEEATKKAQGMSDDEKKKLKDLHWMHCPKCGMEMKTIEINEVEIDKCFACGGLYFDDGELEKVSGREGDFFSGMNTVFEK
jgi:hypothetical protein